MSKLVSKLHVVEVVLPAPPLGLCAMSTFETFDEAAAFIKIANERGWNPSYRTFEQRVVSVADAVLFCEDSIKSVVDPAASSFDRAKYN